MFTLISFATKWGSKHGGINSFNEDFVRACGFAYSREVQVICIAACDNPEEEKKEAQKSKVTLDPCHINLKISYLANPRRESALMSSKNSG